MDSLSGLDLAGLLRVFDQNWNPLGYRLNLDQQGRNWLKEAQGIRNRWAHLPPGGLRSEDAYRDIDTLYRLLGVLGADQATLDRAQAERVDGFSAERFIEVIESEAVWDLRDRTQHRPSPQSTNTVRW